MLNLITLGGLAVRRDGSPFDAPGIRKPLALLAVVAAAGEGGVTRDRLQAFFWPESDAARARGGLKQALYLVRQAVGVDPFRTQGSNVALDPNVIVADVAQFQERVKAGAFDEAAALYGGPFLEGVYLKDVPEFEQWIDAERARLAGMSARTLERLGAEAAQRNDFNAASEWWRRRADLDRLDGRVARLYMEALGATGDREAAIRHARVYAELVRAELGAEPDPEFQTFAKQLRATPAAAPSDASNGRLPDAPRETVPQVDETVFAAAQSTGRSELHSPVDAPRVSPRGLPRHRRTLQLMAGLAVATLIGFVARQRNSGVGTGAAAIKPAVSESGPAIPRGPAPAAARAALNVSEKSRDIGRVLVTPLRNESQDTSAAPFGRLAADWMASGLAQTGLVDVVDAQTVAGLLRPEVVHSDTVGATTPDLQRVAKDVGAKILVVGRYYTTRDSLLVQVMIEDAESGQLLRTLPRIAARTRNYSKALSLLRERIAGAFATLVDPRIESLVDRSTRAPSVVAYQAYVEGLDCFVRSSRGPVGDRPAPPCSAASRFQASIATDSSWSLPYIWLMYTYSNAGNSAAVDTLIAILDRRHDSRSELERYGLEYFKRFQAGDVEGMFAAASHAAALAPGSNWSYSAAYSGYRLRRFAESLKYLRQVDPEHGWARGWYAYVAQLRVVEHMLGDYRAELRDLEKAEKRDPGTSLYIPFRLMALIGLGDSATVIRVADSLMADPPVPHSRLGFIIGSAEEEADAHGHPQLVQQLADRCLAAADPAAVSTLLERREAQIRSSCLFRAGRFAEAKAILERLLNEPPAPVDKAEIRGLESGLFGLETRLGDSARAASHMAKMLALSEDVNRVDDSLMALVTIANVHGMKARVVELLKQVPLSRRLPGGLHLMGASHGLSTYPPFRALTAPRD